MKKPRFEKALPYLFFIFLGFCIADIVILSVRDLMLPQQAPPSKPQKPFETGLQPKGAYSVIPSRNIFNSTGLIPDPLMAKGADGQSGKQQDAAPVPSSLPLGLMGTIVHSNPDKSIANIEVKGKNSVLAFRPQMEIDKLATLVKVERNKVIIRNLNNQRLEFLEMKSTSKISFNAGLAPVTSTTRPAGNEVKAVGQNKFEIKRSDILKYTSNMAEILQQAAMAPKRGANGEIEGFKFLSIQPNSIYTQLGFQNGDVIKGVNGEPVDSPAKAMELYNQLKNSNSIKLKRERDGREEEYDYSITN